MEASLTAIVRPCQLNCVHEDHLLLPIDGGIQAQTAQAATELLVEEDLVGLTVTISRAGWLREMLCCNIRLFLGIVVPFVPSDHNVACYSRIDGTVITKYIQRLDIEPVSAVVSPRTSTKSTRRYLAGTLGLRVGAVRL